MATPTPTTPRPPSNFQGDDVIHRAAWKAGFLGALSTATAILSQRLIVLVSATGGIMLTYLALQQPDAYKLGALGIYCAGVVIPAIWLARG
ncbi:MAG TPA: hypothetical protein VHT52_21755 [Stellaceae bacterium]|nr:hypothetical protein [Stellaceae bacterium]